MSTNYVSGASSLFVQQLEVFVNHATHAFGSIVQASQRQWAVPYNQSGWDFDVFNYTGTGSIGLAFDRTLLNAQYWTALVNGANLDDTYGRVAECRCAKTQIDMLGAMERSFRERSRSYVRAAYNVGSRYRGHADAQGPIRDIVAVVNRMIMQANTDNIPPQRPRIDTRQAFNDLDSKDINLASMGVFI